MYTGRSSSSCSCVIHHFEIHAAYAYARLMRTSRSLECPDRMQPEKTEKCRTNSRRRTPAKTQKMHKRTPRVVGGPVRTVNCSPSIDGHHHAAKRLSALDVRMGSRGLRQREGAVDDDAQLPRGDVLEVALDNSADQLRLQHAIRAAEDPRQLSV